MDSTIDFYISENLRLQSIVDSYKKIGHVYRITFSDNTVYIGSTKQDVMKRVSAHMSSIKTKTNNCPKLVSKIKEMNGEFKVTHFEFEYTEISQLREREYIEIKYIPDDLCLNTRYNFSPQENNDFSIPVSCKEWVEMLGLE